MYTTLNETLRDSETQRLRDKKNKRLRDSVFGFGFRIGIWDIIAYVGKFSILIEKTNNLEILNSGIFN